MSADVESILRGRLATHHDVAMALLFGSTARGTDTPRSDITSQCWRPPTLSSR